ncbi:GAF domain-containing protein [Oceanobacillus sojae]|uniref:GAF domain-containing protein n=1 Tax=Oceanobacillus sojae TaxID=582851 RepID=UPI00362A0465
MFEDSITYLTQEIPWLREALVILFLVSFVIFIITVTLKIKKGEGKVSFLGFKFESNEAYYEIQRQFEDLNEHSEYQLQVIKFLHQINQTVPDTNALSRSELESGFSHFYDMFLTGIISLLTKTKGNTVRAAIFYKKEENLVILHGRGFSPEGTRKLKLGLINTKAGYCFMNNKIDIYNKLSADPTFERNPNSSKHYESLLCAPITYDGKTLGVLSIDGLKENSFDSDDKDYVTYFITAMSPLLHKEFLYREVQKLDSAKEDEQFETKLRRKKRHGIEAKVR